MGLSDDLEAEVADIIDDAWEERKGQSVPDPEDLGLGNDAVKLDGTVLYADIADSTKMVDSKKPAFAAAIYKSYLTCAARILKSEGGTITAYDGDRIMAVFLGDSKNSDAAKAGLHINHAVVKIINPAILRRYPKSTYQLKQVVGIDTSPLFVARIGIRNANDLVWVGRAANYAAKLSALDSPNTVYMTDAVFRRLEDDSKYGPNRELMWERRVWKSMDDMPIHRSTWTWGF